MKILKVLIGLLILIITASCSTSETNQAFQHVLATHGTAYNLWVRNGKILNGQDSLAFKADLLILGDSIVYIGVVDSALITAHQIIDAKEKYVTPGFIDTHAHGNPLQTPEFDNFLAMGVTSICLGQDGFSPIYEDIGEWMQVVNDTIPGVNIAMFVGHSTLRQQSGVDYQKEPSETDLEKMGFLLQNGLEKGCFGMTTGLEYTPGTYAGDNELEALAKVVGSKNGLIMSHIRNEDDEAIEASIEELLRQGKHCNVHVSHMKVVYGKGPERAAEVLKLLADGRGDSFSVTADIYPYTASYTGIGIVFPAWAKAPNDYEQVKKTRRAELLDFLRQKVLARNGPEATLFGTAPYAGKTLAEVSQGKRKTPLKKYWRTILVRQVLPELIL